MQIQLFWALHKTWVALECPRTLAKTPHQDYPFYVPLHALRLFLRSLGHPLCVKVLVLGPYPGWAAPIILATFFNYNDYICKINFTFHVICILKLFIFRERGREGERRRETLMCTEKHWLVASCIPPTGDLAGNPSMCLDQNGTTTFWFMRPCPTHWATSNMKLHNFLNMVIKLKSVLFNLSLLGYIG